MATSGGSGRPALPGHLVILLGETAGDAENLNNTLDQVNGPLRPTAVEMDDLADAGEVMGGNN